MSVFSFAPVQWHSSVDVQNLAPIRKFNQLSSQILVYLDDSFILGFTLWVDTALSQILKIKVRID